MSGEHNYEKLRMGLRALESRIEQCEAQLGLQPAAAPAGVPGRAAAPKPRTAVQARGVPATVSVRRVSAPGVPFVAPAGKGGQQEPSRPAALAGIDVQSLASDLTVLAQDAVARALASVLGSPAPAAAPPPPPPETPPQNAGDADDLSWLAAEGAKPEDVSPVSG